MSNTGEYFDDECFDYLEDCGFLYENIDQENNKIKEDEMVIDSKEDNSKSEIFNNIQVNNIQTIKDINKIEDKISVENYEDMDYIMALQTVYDDEESSNNKNLEKIEIITTNPSNNNICSQEENFDVFEYFSIYNQLYFEEKVGCVRLEWSKKMTLCAGVFSVRNNEPVIRLSEPLLKFRSIKEIKETLLHEMIHAWVFVEEYDQSDDRSGHGIHFKMKMYEINKNTGLNITVYHSFHEEVDFYRKHIWRCEGKCRNQPPYYGYVKRAMNRAPGHYDSWWNQHLKNCGGKFIKIQGNENTQQEGKRKKVEDKKNKISKMEKVTDDKTLDSFVKIVKK